MNSKKFVIDVGHRWNSTYVLLKSCKGYEALITEFYNYKLTRDDDNLSWVIPITPLNDPL